METVAHQLGASVVCKHRPKDNNVDRMSVNGRSKGSDGLTKVTTSSIMLPGTHEHLKVFDRCGPHAATIDVYFVQ